MTVYLDNSATTAVCPEAAEKMMYMMTEGYGNPSSTHAMGRAARAELDAARAAVARAIGCDGQEVYFTSGGTEADNIAVLGACEKNYRLGRHVIVGANEHDAVLRSAGRLQEKGFEVTYVNPRADGVIDPEDFRAAVRPDTILASIMTVNNEVGAVNDIKAMRDILKAAAPRALFHTDAVQAFCKTDISPKKTGADLITVSSHKIHGPKGAGALYIKRGVKISPRTFGGGQESGMRPGTEAVANIAAFGTAAKIAHETMAENREKFKTLRCAFIEKVCAAVPDAVVIGGGADHILSISLPGYRSEVLLNYLDSRGVYISKGSACKRGARSHVLESMHLPPKVIDGAVRISFSRFNTLDEINCAADVMIEAAERLIKV